MKKSNLFLLLFFFSMMLMMFVLTNPNDMIKLGTQDRAFFALGGLICSLASILLLALELRDERRKEDAKKAATQVC